MLNVNQYRVCREYFEINTINRDNRRPTVTGDVNRSVDKRTLIFNHSIDSYTRIYWPISALFDVL